MSRSLEDLEQVVKRFVEIHWDHKSPLLAAYSGGPDSKALLYALLQLGFHPFLHVAHVDHGWREESREEAVCLERECSALRLPFHTIRFSQKTSEEEARLLRLQFYRELMKKTSYQAVLLGHQGDDVAETVLKRAFEGASLTHLFGMAPVSCIEGIPLWRPMLSLRRAKIEQYLEHLQLSALRDPTNSDPRYLRSRMRTVLLPELGKLFGKDVSSNLILLAQRSLELNEYLHERVKGYQEQILKGPFGLCLERGAWHRLELGYLLQIMAKEEGFCFSRKLLEQILDWMQEDGPYRESLIAGRIMAVEGGRFFLLARTMPYFEGELFLNRTHLQSGDWTVEIKEGSTSNEGWKDLWRGELSILRREGDQFLTLAPPGFGWTDKIPFVLRKICPIIVPSSLKPRSIFSKQTSGHGKIINFLVSTKTSSG
jgi:tRNA(Ile)-lysidine synthase